MDVQNVFAGSDTVATSGISWVQEAGSFWKRLDKVSKSNLVALLDIAAAIEREGQGNIQRVLASMYPAELSDVALSSHRRIEVKTGIAIDGLPIIYLPNELLYAAEISTPDGEVFELGRDYTWPVDRSLKLNRFVSLPSSLFISLRSVLWCDAAGSRFWARALRHEPLDLTSDNTAVLRQFLKISRAGASELQLRELIGLICQVPMVKTRAKVLQVLTSEYESPIVITTAETLQGTPDDTPTISVGDVVLPGDTVFDSLRFHDFVNNQPPTWMTSLKIPGRYFSPLQIGSLQFSNSDQDPETYTVDNRVRIRFPITGAANDIAAFWQYVDAETTRLGYGFAELATNHPRPGIEQIPSKVNPLRLVWALRLRFGTSASVIREAPTPRILGQLGLVRRALPPWLTHIFHFQQSVSESHDAFC